MSPAVRVILEHGPEGRPALFEAPSEVVAALGPDGVHQALVRLDAARARGAWVAGWIGYEAAAAFEPRLAHVARGAGPLLVMGIFDAPPRDALASGLLDDPGPGTLLTAPEPLVTRAAYGGAIARILAWIAAGDCYQVNLTFPLRARFARPDATPLSLYAALRAAGPVGHGALVELGEGPAIVSLSPELFFRTDAANRIVARPMKLSLIHI